MCVKGLDFPSEDISVRLVEWIEMLNILGADKVRQEGLAIFSQFSELHCARIQLIHGAVQ